MKASHTSIRPSSSCSPSWALASEVSAQSSSGDQTHIAICLNVCCNQDLKSQDTKQVAYILLYHSPTFLYQISYRVVAFSPFFFRSHFLKLSLKFSLLSSHDDPPLLLSPVFKLHNFHTLCFPCNVFTSAIHVNYFKVLFIVLHSSDVLG